MYNEVEQILGRAYKNGSYQTRVGVGQVDGWGFVHKFGEGIVDINFEIIWDDMINTPYPILIDTNLEMTIQSDDAGDVGQTIRVAYAEFADNKWVYKQGKAVTNGLASVTVQEVDEDDNVVGNAQIMIPYRMVNEGTGVTNVGSALGTITLENGGTNYALIDNGNNQTLMAIFPICDDYTAIIHGVGRSVVGVNKECEFHYKFTPYGQVSQTKRTVGLVQSAEYENFIIPFVFQKGILTVEAKVQSGTALVSAWWDMNLVETDKI